MEPAPLGLVRTDGEETRSRIAIARAGGTAAATADSNLAGSENEPARPRRRNHTGEAIGVRTFAELFLAPHHQGEMPRALRARSLTLCGSDGEGLEVAVAAGKALDHAREVHLHGSHLTTP
jgi:hypothetical protein